MRAGEELTVEVSFGVVCEVLFGRPERLGIECGVLEVERVSLSLSDVKLLCSSKSSSRDVCGIVGRVSESNGFSDIGAAGEPREMKFDLSCFETGAMLRCNEFDGDWAIGILLKGVG